MIITYYPHSKNTHNLKNVEFENICKVFFKIKNFEKSFTTCKWVVMCMTYKKKVVVYNEKKKHKVVSIFVQTSIGVPHLNLKDSL
jgi:hypothetical protein